MAQTALALLEGNRELREAVMASDTLELQDLEQTAKEASDTIHKKESAYTEVNINKLPINLHEIQGLD